MHIHVKKSILFVLSLAILGLCAFPVYAQQRANDTIPIAIPDSRPFGVDRPTPQQSQIIEGYTNIIITEISSIPYFEVLERKQANELYAEIAYQLQTGGEMTEAVANTRLRGARAILITGFGEIFERIVITARLVDLQSGRVLFAETIYTDQGSIQQAMKELSASMREKGSELGMVVSIDDIEHAVKAKSWKDAKRLADLYLRNAPGDARVRSLYETIAINRAGGLYSDAKRLVRLKLFKEARIAIDEAIALSPRSEYYAYRDTIGQSELDYQYKQKAEAQAREEALKTGKVRQGFWRQASDYLQAITIEEARLGLSYMPSLSLSEDLMLDMRDGAWGFDFGWVNAYRPEGGQGALNWSWYAGVYGGYEPVMEGGSGAMLSAYLAPLSAQSLRLGPLVLHAGIDCGAFFGYGPYDAEALKYGFSIGGMAELGIRVFARSGLFTAVKADWRLYPGDFSRSGPALRVSAGISL